MNDAYNAALFAGILWGGEEMRDYLSSLPDEIQLAVEEHAQEIHSEEEMRAFADKMMKKR